MLINCSASANANARWVPINAGGHGSTDVVPYLDRISYSIDKVEPFCLMQRFYRVVVVARYIPIHIHLDTMLKLQSEEHIRDITIEN